MRQADELRELVEAYLRQPREDLARLVFAVLLLDSWLDVQQRARRSVVASVT